MNVFRDRQVQEQQTIAQDRIIRAITKYRERYISGQVAWSNGSTIVSNNTCQICNMGCLEDETILNLGHGFVCRACLMDIILLFPINQGELDDISREKTLLELKK